jgi:hypothetical protein
MPIGHALDHMVPAPSAVAHCTTLTTRIQIEPVCADWPLIRNLNHSKSKFSVRDATWAARIVHAGQANYHEKMHATSRNSIGNP